MSARDERHEQTDTSTEEEFKPLEGEKPGWWRKERAVNFLEITPRTLQRYVKEGRIGSDSVTIRGVKVAIYNEDDIRQFKHARDNPPPLPRSPTVMPPQRSEETALAMLPREQATGLVELLAAIAAQGRTTSSSSVPIENKLVLTLEEASALTSLSIGFLRQEIKSGKLKAKIMGRGYRVKRADLDTYVKKL